MPAGLIYNSIVDENYSRPIAKGAEIFSCTKSYFHRLKRQKRLDVEIKHFSIKYYWIDPSFVGRYKNIPKSRGEKPG